MRALQALLPLFLASIPALGQVAMRVVPVDASELDAEIGGVHWCADVLIEVADLDTWKHSSLNGGVHIDDAYIYRLFDPNASFPVMTAPGHALPHQRFATFVNLPRPQFSQGRFGRDGEAIILSLQPVFTDTEVAIGFGDLPLLPVDGDAVRDNAAIIRLTFDLTESPHQGDQYYFTLGDPVHPADVTIAEIDIDILTQQSRLLYAASHIFLFASADKCVALGCNRADVDADCDVDLADLGTLLSNYGTVGAPGHSGGDLDGDGDVDVSDLAVLLSRFGNSCNGPLPSIELTRTVLGIPEGETASLGVSLRDDPLEPVEVTVERIVGDDDLTRVQQDTLRFDSSNYAIPQSVAYFAAGDSDRQNGELGIRFRAAGVPFAFATVFEMDDDALIFEPAQAIQVEEGGEATFSVCLGAPPANGIATIAVLHDYGDFDIVRLSPETLVFTSENFDVPQTVVLGALEDPDRSNGSAVIDIHAIDDETIPSRVFFAHEIDND